MFNDITIIIVTRNYVSALGITYIPTYNYYNNDATNRWTNETHHDFTEGETTDSHAPTANKNKASKPTRIFLFSKIANHS